MEAGIEPRVCCSRDRFAALETLGQREGDAVVIVQANLEIGEHLELCPCIQKADSVAASFSRYQIVRCTYFPKDARTVSAAFPHQQLGRFCLVGWLAGWFCFGLVWLGFFGWLIGWLVLFYSFVFVFGVFPLVDERSSNTVSQLPICLH